MSYVVKPLCIKVYVFGSWFRCDIVIIESYKTRIEIMLTAMPVKVFRLVTSIVIDNIDYFPFSVFYDEFNT